MSRESAASELPRLRGRMARAVAPIGKARLSGPFWWQIKGPLDLEARRHKTKIDALRAFASDPINARTLEEFALYDDPSARARLYRACSGEFDAVNERYDLKGAKRVCSIDDALWNLLPKRGREGFYVEDLDLGTLNAIADAAQTRGHFRLPEPIAEAVALELEAEHHAGAGDEARRARARAMRRRTVRVDPDVETGESLRGMGWPLTHLDCEDGEGHLVSCDDPQAATEPVRAVYRPSVHGNRQRVYLEPDDEALAAATSDRSHRGAIRGEGEIAFPFGGARACGGKADAGIAYLVGEHGPEIFVPSTSGRIAPKTSGDTNRTALVVLGVGAAALATVGLVVWWRRRRRRRRRR